jgi:hypothetical protein
MAMLKTLKIAGVEHPFLFGFYAMLFVEEDLGVNIDKILDGTAGPMDMLRALPAFTLAGIKNGAYASSGTVLELSVQDIKIEFDKDPSIMKSAEVLVAQALSDFTAARTEPDTETAKKGRQGVKNPQA